MPLSPGLRLGPYEILDPLGAGGMGEVYRARDAKLGRDVALKVLPEAFALDADRMARFQREAKVLASLNHPNIATIHGLEDSGSTHALVMELVEGPTLADRIKDGAIPIEEALRIAKQICEGLEYAHERGIVHRDLKPANVKETNDDAVKILDFGLAKALEADPSSIDVATSPTLSRMATQAGVLLGTAAYMSPEQAKGKPVDRRADIWAFGCVLYEMLTGRMTFHGESVTDTLAAVIKEEPDWTQLPAATPIRVRVLLQRCLQKDPRQRLRDIGDARISIDEVLSGAPDPSLAGAAGISVPLWRSTLPWASAGALAAVLSGLALVHFREKPPTPSQHMRFQIQAPENTTLGPKFSLSPDGRKLAFVTGDFAGTGRLWVHFFESGEFRELTNATGSPFWSPDSRFIGYPLENKIKKIEATGGSPQTLVNFTGPWGGGAWNQDDEIIFASETSGLFGVPVSGGLPVQITAVDLAHREEYHYRPSFLPDGRHFLYVRYSTDKERTGIYLGSVDAKPEQQSSLLLVASDVGAVYAPSADSSTGYLLFMREATLMAQPFDNQRLELKGRATPVAEQLGNGQAFSVSANDVLVFWRSAASERQLTWYDRQGKVLGTVGELGDYEALALSPDGARVALTKRTGPSSNVWLLDLARDTSTRFTFGSTDDSHPIWSPDGSRIIFRSGNDLYEKQVSGVKDAEPILKSSEFQDAWSWSSDGRLLLYDVHNPKTNMDMWVLPLGGGKKPIPFLVTEFTEGAASFSPDGHWVAYTSDESGHFEIYVRSFAMNSAGTAIETEGKWQISNGSGFGAHWRGDGRELYYRALDGQLMSVEMETNPKFRPGKPQSLGFVGGTGTSSGLLWDSTADGRRFLVAAPKSNRPEPYTVILNWQSGLKK